MTMPTSERQPNRRDDHLTDAELNELVDGTLAGRELERSQAHLASCQECDERYRTLLATVSALKQAPSVMPRRSFQLTPEQAKLPDPVPGRFDRFADWIVPGTPAIKLATIAVALLFISVTAFDVLTNQSGQDDLSPSSSVQREADLPAPAAEIAQPEATEAIVLGESNESTSDSSDVDGAAEGNGPGSSATESEPSDESFSSEAMQEAPAPAAAVQLPVTVASPTAEPTSTPIPTATSEPTASATPAPEDDGWRTEFTLSWWRIAELGLFMILVWLLVSWIGRSRVGNLDE